MIEEIDLEEIKKGEVLAFKKLFDLFYPKLTALACRFVDEEIAKDLVQDLFFSYWQKKETIEAENIHSFFYKWIQNSCLNYLKHQNVEGKYVSQVQISELRITSMNKALVENNAIKELVTQDVYKIIEETINKLSPRCSEAFRLCFFDDMSHKEVAKVMNISVRTVETHIRQAVSFLRLRIDNSSMLIILIYNLFQKIS